ncbi:MAG: FG-GAP-like repeat-containing protein [Flavobacteriales bacterium]|nr:FG-GAP-like repeat-containing protein [Flavobacteriales bacterium]
MKRIYYTLLLLLSYLVTQAQFNLTPESELTVCQSSSVFQVKYINDGAASLTGVNLKIKLPQGIAYVASSVVEQTSLNVQEFNVTSDTALIFSVNDINVGDSVQFSIAYTANQDAIAFQNSGGIFRNGIDLFCNEDTLSTQSDSYNILYPVLSILSVTPKNQTIVSGTSSSRTINIINGGNGKTDRIYLTDVQNTGNLTVLGSNIGTISGDTIILSGADFSSIGNNDHFLDQNESISIVETFSGTSCSDVLNRTSFNVLWGCEGDQINSSTSYSNITIDFQTPSLKLVASESLNSCFGNGNASAQQLSVINTGSGLASNVAIDIYKSKGNGYNENIFSRIDENSLTYKVGANGQVINVTNAVNTVCNSAGDYSCLGNSPIGKVAFTLPDLLPDDTIYINWDSYSCCLQTCSNDAVKGWESDVSYSDVCGSQNYSKSLVGQNDNSQYVTFFTETPLELYANQTEDVTFLFSSYKNNLPVGPGANYTATFTLQEGITYEGINLALNGASLAATSVNYNTNDNIVTAIFPANTGFNFNKSEMTLSISGDCGSAGWKTIDMTLDYVPDTTCSPSCAIPMECNTQVSTYLYCPLGACASLNVLDFQIERTNFGAPDNNIDGLADGSGSLDFSKVKVNRAMVGDTIKATATAVIAATAATWDYANYTSSVDYGSSLSFIDATVTIYDASATTSHIVNGVTATTATSGNQRDFDFDLSVANLSGLNASLIGYQYATEDSIKVEMNYRVSSSVSGLIKETLFINEFYLSAVANPTSGQKESCIAKHGSITLIGYSWRNNSANNATVNSCTKNIVQNFGLSIGPLSSNYGGGNLFPYECRQWGFLKEAKVVIPTHYSVISSKIQQYRTRRTNYTTTQTINGIMPDAINGDTLYYDLEQYYNSGQLVVSDDGFHGKLTVEIAPACTSPKNVYENIYWTFNYEETAAINGVETGYISASGPDRIRYSPPALEVSSEAPWQDANTRSVEWDYKVKNTSSAGADNAWVHINPPSNIVIDSIVNDNTSQTLTLQNDIYLIGSISGGATANLTIYGTYSNCDTVLMTVYSGFECTGYPTDFASFTCGYESMVLYVEPKQSAFQTRLTSELLEDPCSKQVNLTVDVTSVKIAHMYDMTIEVISSDTTKIIVLDDSSQFQYNISNSYNTIGDPTFSNGIYEYAINDYEASFQSDGIPGILDVSNNRYRLRTALKLGEQFLQGDYVQIRINGKNACTESVPTVNLAYDPNSKFQKDNTAGLHLDIGNSWSASWGDYDNDGYDDLFVPVNDITEPNILYHNNGDGTFSKVTTGAIVTDLGTSISGTWGDYDNDGNLDLFVTNNVNSTNKLYHNNGDGTFTSIQNNPVVDEGIYSHSAAWADYNQDGNLDLVVSDFHSTHFNYLFKGDGQGGFTPDASSVVAQSATSAVGVAWGDMDNDGDLDLFIANTNGENNQLFKNETGVFTEILTGAVVTDGGNSVGGAWGDYDNDGDLDLYVTNSSIIEPNFFYENNGDGTFLKITNSIVVTNISNSHGASWIDFDNDADLDLIVANNQGNKNYLFANNGNKTFTKMNNAITEDENDSYGTAWSDFDNDGDYDLFVSNIDENANDFFINEKGSCTNHIGVKLVGCNSNRFGIGAMVKVKATINGSPVWQTKHVSTQTSAMGGQNSSTLLFGILDATAIDSLIILWPSGVVTNMLAPSINQIHTINEECGAKISGTVYHDANSNGVQDQGEKGIPNHNLMVTPGNFQVFTDENGYYQLYVDNGTYTINQSEHANWTQTTPANEEGYVVEVNQENETHYSNRDFGNNAVCTSPDLTMHLGTTAFRKGLTNMLNVVVNNEGAYDATDNITVALVMTDNVYILDNNWILSNENGGYRTYSLTFSGIDALSDTVFNLTDSVDVNAALEELVTIDATVSYSNTECSTENNAYSMTDGVVGSLDPNDKMVFVMNKGIQKIANRNDRLYYKIRFQNIGNYAARIVKIIDTLSNNLDWNTFEIESSSHPFSVSLVDGVVTWVNYKIELPDSASNPEGSMGYVSFSILPKQDLAPYTPVYNKAAIQFDYNEYIITNNTKILISEHLSDTDQPFVLAYPNPANENTNILLIGHDKEHIEMERIELTSIHGKIVRSIAVNSTKVNVPLNGLRSGVYIIIVVDRVGNRYQSRLVIN